MAALFFLFEKVRGVFVAYVLLSEGAEITRRLTGRRMRMGKARGVRLEEREGILGKECTKCNEWLSLDDFAKHPQGAGGRNSRCKKCKAVYKKSWDRDHVEHNKNYHEEHKAKRNENSRLWKLENPERDKELKREWAKRNEDKCKLKQLNREAMKKCLPHDFKRSQMNEIRLRFRGCALTGDDDIHWDHVIPLSIGHGGTTYGNMIPLRADLNISKYSSNIFEWFEANRQRFELSQDCFDNIIAWLASANAMTVEEYRDYVYRCHANPRNIDELEDAAI